MATLRDGVSARVSVRSRLLVLRSSLARHRIVRALSTLSLLILLLAQFIGSWPFAANVVFAATTPKVLPASQTFQQFEQLARQSAQQRKPARWYQPRGTSPMTKQELAFVTSKHALPPSAEPPTMQPIRQQLSTAFLTGSAGTQPLDLVSSDHRLEVVIPAGAFDLSHATIAGSTPGKQRPLPTPTPGITPTAAATSTPPATPSSTVTATSSPTSSPTVTITPSPTPGSTSAGVSGPLTLVITQVFGQFAGEMNALGEYQMQILNTQGKQINGIVLRQPLTLSYHYQPSEMAALDLAPDAILLSWPDLALADRAAHRSTTQDIVLFTDHPATRTLSAQSHVLDAGPFVVSGDPQNQSPPNPNEAEVSGNTGQVSYSSPIQLAPAPDGFAPQLTLSYSSGNLNGRQSVTSPAGDVGDGWMLSLGAITAQVYPSSSSGGAQTWYSISGVDGISDRLVPDPSHSGWYLTQHLSYLRIHKITANNEPCFQVWDKSGTTYNFGCSTDSLQYRHDSTGLSLYQWDLNEMNAANDGPNSTVKQINITYFQDCGSDTGSCKSASQSTSYDTIRDAAVAQIQYGSGPGSSFGTLATVSGTVDFEYWAPYVPSGGLQWAIPYTQSYDGYSYSCDGTPPTGTNNMRCDDPQAEGSVNPPAVMSTLTLLSVTSYVGNDHGTGSYAAYKYRLQYQDTPFYGCTDPLSQATEYCAGDHLVTKVIPAVFQGGTPNKLQPVLFDYKERDNTYYDETQAVGSGHYSVKTDWQYLADYYDTNTGVGDHIDYATAYNNSHGTPYDSHTGDNRFDPTYCDTHSDCTGSFAYPDDRAWTEQVVSDLKRFGIDSSAMSQAVTTYSYVLKQTGNACPPDTATPQDTACVGDNWWPLSDTDWQDFYHSEFHGFNYVETVSPAGDLTQDNYFSTDGWGSSSGYGNNAFSGDLTQEDVYQGDSTSGPHLLDITNTYAGYNSTSMPCDNSVSDPYIPCEAIVSSSVTTTYEGSSATNPPTLTTSYYYDDYNPGTDPSKWGLNLSGYHNLVQQTVAGNNTPENPNPTVTDVWSYIPTDSGYNNSGWYFYDVNKIAHSEVDDSSGHTWQCQSITYDENAPSGAPNGTPGAGWPTTVSTYSSANCTPGNFTTPLTTSSAGYDVYGNLVATVDAVGTAHASFYGSSGISNKNGCTLTTPPSIMSSAWSKSYYTTCTAYDSVYNALPTSTTNAFSQMAQTQYDTGQGDLPKTITDVNGRQTGYTYSYDGSGNRTVQVSEPGETNGYTTQSVTHSGCASSIPSGATTPCFEIDSTSSAYPTAISRTYYDGLGRTVETRTPGPDSGYDTVQFTVSNDANHTSFTSVPFEVTSGSSWVDPATATDRTGHAPAGTTTYSDALSRIIAMRDPLFGTLPGISCPSINANATACTVYTLDSPHGSSTLYDTAKSIDPTNHVSETFVDALGRTTYTQEYSGLFKQSPTPIQQVSYLYDVLGQPTQATTTDLAPQNGQNVTSVTVTMTYDDLGRLTKLVDPDRGTHSYTYDADGQLLTDTSGSRVVGSNDDLLGRLGCVQDGAATVDADGSCTNGSTPLVQNTYDTSQFSGSTDYPKGRLTKSQSYSYYPEGGSTQSTEKYQYDERGRVITEQLLLSTPGSWNLSLPTYQLAQTYTDSNQPQTTQTSTINGQGQGTTQYTFTNVYDGTLGVLTGLSSTTVSQANLASLSFTINGLLGAINSQTNTGTSLASETFSYDGDLRPTEETAAWQSGSGNTGTFFDEARGYDAASNVDTVTTTMSQPNGQSGSNSMVQNFCYNEQDQLVWAGNSGTQPSPGNGTCGSGMLSNTFSGGSYSSAFAYTHLGQLWQGPLNGTGATQQYLYCNSSNPHQLTDLVPTGKNYSCSNLPSGANLPYSLAYNNWGDATSRAISGVTATLNYNDFDQMVEWHIPNTNQAWFGYDASGTRTVQHTTIGSTSSTTIYAFGLEEYSYDGSGTLLSSTHYYRLAGHLLGELQVTGSSSTTNFFLTDGLGSVLGIFSNTASSAALLSTQLFTPYGTQLVANGNSLGQYTTKGFTGQYADSVSGLDYYVSRYYDPVAGVFLSADTVEDNLVGMNPYGYVGNNPETNNDPTGQMVCFVGCGGSGGGGSSGGGGGNGGGGGTSQGWYVGGPTQTLPPPSSPPSQVDPNNPLTWPIYNPAADTPPVDIAPVAAGGILSGLCPVCFVVAAVGAIGLTLLTPETLGNADMIPPWQGEPITSPVYHDQPTPPSPYDSPVYHDTPIPGSPQTQTGGGSGGKKPPSRPIAPPPWEKPDHSKGSGKVTLYRAIGVNELNDVLHYGDYDLSPHGGGKYFSFTEEGAQQFANSSFNAGRNMTLTSIEVPSWMLEQGFEFFDPGGGNESIHFADEVLPQLYEVSGPVNILDAPWVPDIGALMP